ncbi:phage tail sheath family protein [Amycolatopsis sp. NPDC003731]
MPYYMRPGVYIEELPVQELLSHGRPIDRPQTEIAEPKWVAEHSIAAFVGLAAEGPPDVATLVHNWKEFTSRFGGVVDGTYLGHAVRGFFANGGKSCYVVRVNGREETRADVDDLVGDAQDRTGLAGLEAIEDVSVVAVPDVLAAYRAGAIDMEDVKAVQLALIAHCELMGDRIAILDCPPGLSVQQVREWRTDVTGYDTKYGTLYYPWLRIPTPDNRTIAVPPSGHLAGVYSRVDLHRNAANQPVRGAVGVESDLLLDEQSLLNPYGINALASAAGQGPVVWGARTLSSDPAWRFLRTRRLMNFIGRNIRHGTQWVIFGNARERKVWQEIRQKIGELLMMLWRSGALAGDDPDEAYYVKCDEETNPPESLDTGLITVDCAVAVQDGPQLDFRVVYFLG